MKQEKKKRAVPIWMIAVTLLLTAVFLFLSLWWFGASYPYFDSVSVRGPRIPGLDALSPQGLCALPEGPYDYAMSGYVSGKPSRLYLIADDGGTEAARHERYVTFTKGGKAITTHFGGVTCSQDYLYIASGKEIIRIPLADVLAADNASAVEIKDSFPTGLQNAFCYLYGGMLFAGEFYRPGNYETDPSHHITKGETVNRAFVYAFPLDETKEGGVADMVPAKVLSVGSQVQGIAITDQQILLSCSYGLPDSSLLCYANPLSKEGEDSVTVSGREVPLYFLGESERTLRMPCMSEEICIQGENVVILFESMSMQYRFVVHSRISNLISVPLSAIPEAGTAQ